MLCTTQATFVAFLSNNYVYVPSYVVCNNAHLYKRFTVLTYLYVKLYFLSMCHAYGVACISLNKHMLIIIEFDQVTLKLACFSEEECFFLYILANEYLHTQLRTHFSVILNILIIQIFMLSRRAVVSREAKKKQYARAFQAYATTTVSYLHGWSV